MGNCAKANCQRDDDYACAACRKKYCDDHCANSSYFSHLRKLGGAIESAAAKGGYLCAACIEATPGVPHHWYESIMDRRCAHHGCAAELNSLWVVKEPCARCGLLFCGSHRKSLSSLGASVRESILREGFAADSICETCVPRHQADPGMAARIAAEALAHARPELDGFVEAARSQVDMAVKNARDQLVAASAGVRGEAEILLHTARGQVDVAVENARGQVDVAVKNARGQLDNAAGDVRMHADRLVAQTREQAENLLSTASSQVEKTVSAADSRLRGIADNYIAQAGQIAEGTYRKVGLRAALAALAVVMVAHYGPIAAHGTPEIGIFHRVWSWTAVVGPAALLVWEFLLPGLKDDHLRPYALAFLALAAMAVGYHLTL